jgi:RNA polymerase sporulation-specific sigma factor
MENSSPRKKKARARKPVVYADLTYTQLVDIVRKSRNESHKNLAFNEIEKRMTVKIKQISYRFRIPGSNVKDVYQESLYALRYKAIKDYDETRGNDTGPYPFDKFAVLCIRRHLSTKLKSSYQNKKKVLNSSISLDQDRSDSSDDSLVLSDIVHSQDGSVLDDIEHSEYFKNLFKKLYEKLSKFEKQVFLLYIEKYSYDEISDKINKDKKTKTKINVKSVDNALSRIKHKAHDIFSKYGEE